MVTRIVSSIISFSKSSLHFRGAEEQVQPRLGVTTRWNPGLTPVPELMVEFLHFVVTWIPHSLRPTQVVAGPVRLITNRSSLEQFLGNNAESKIPSS